MSKNSPPEIIAKLNAAVVKVLGTAEAKEQFLAQGGEAVSSTPQEFVRIISGLRSWLAWRG